MTMREIYTEYKDYAIFTKRMRSGMYRGVVTTPDFTIVESPVDFSKPQYARDLAIEIVDNLVGGMSKAEAIRKVMRRT